MHHRSKRVENLDTNIAPLKTDWIRHAIAIDVHIDHRRVDKLHFELLVASFPSQFLTDTFKCFVLDSLNNILQLNHIDLDIWPSATIADRSRAAFDQLAGNTKHSIFGDDTCHLLGPLQRRVAILYDTGDIGYRTRTHVRKALPLPANADDLDFVTSHLSDQSLYILCTDVERDKIL